MSRDIEFKSEKEGKKAKQLRSLILKHFPRARKLHIITEKNDFFHWKSLIQEYSNKKGMCEFVDNKDLLPKELRLELESCISDELQLEIAKLKKYLISTKTMILENKDLPEHIKLQLLTSSNTLLEKQIN